MEKLRTKNVLNKLEFLGAVFVTAVGFLLIFGSSASAQLPAPAVPANPAAPAPTAEVERVIVTGSNIPTAEETGPNPVDTYRPQDIEKLGIRNATDLTTFIPQEAGGTVNQNITNGGDGTVQLNLRGLLPKETLVLIDGKRVAQSALNGGIDIQLIPFSMVDHIDILKDGASAVYGADAVAGVVNFFLIHKFRGLEIGVTYGNTDLGASNDMGEWEAWLKAGTGDDKTDIVVIADFYQRTGGLFSRDRDISSNANFRPFGGFDIRSSNFPGRVQGFRLIPKLFFSSNSPTPHSAPNAATSPFYTLPGAVPGIQNSVLGDGDYIAYNFAAVTPALPPSDRQVFYGSFTRDLCDKYLTVFTDFKVARSFFDSALAAVPFLPDPFKNPGQAVGVSGSAGGISVPIQNPFNPFTVPDATWISPSGEAIPVTTGVRFRAIRDTGVRPSKITYWDYLFDVGLKGEMGEFGDYFKTWNWETGFRYARNEGSSLALGNVSQPGLRDALLDTDPATAFNPFGGTSSINSNAARNRVYVNLHNTATYELPLAYATINGDLFNLPAGPVSFAIGGEYHGERWDNKPDSLNTTFSSIGATDLEGSRVNRDVWSIYEEVRVPFTSPTWNFPGFYSFEVDFAEREEWYSQNTSNVLSSNTPQGHSQYNAQKPKVSVRWQPLDPKYIGALTLRGSYTEAFHAPTVLELSPAGAQSFPLVVDPFSSQTEPQVEERQSGNPQLHPEVAYEWTYGAVYSPKWLKGLTLSADWWHIDMRDIVSILGAQFVINNFTGTDLVQRGPSTIPGELGPINLVIDPNENLSGAIFEGLDYEAIYILDSTIFGHGDWGRLTTTVNGTWLSRAVLQPDANSKPFGIAGQFISTSFSLTSSLPRNRANISLFYDGPADTWLGGLDVGAVVHWTGQYEDDNVDVTGNKPQTPRTDPLTGKDSPFVRKIREWVTLDLILNYTFNFPAPAPAEVPGFAKDGGKNVLMKDGKEKNVVPVSTAEYGCSNWKWWLNNTTITVGMQNVLDEDPPFVLGALQNGYDESLTTIKGRFWYVGLKKRF
jgi:iron complex outermembrane recepter protein